MTPTLIVLGLLALGVGIVAFATRRLPARPYEQRQEQDTAWGEAPAPQNAIVDPFAHAPSPAAPTHESIREPERQS